MNYKQFLNITDTGDSYYNRALYSQAALETGNFTSNIFANYNNLFGMRPSQSREKFYQDIYHSPTNGTFAAYDSYAYSILDRIDLDEYNDIVSPQTDADTEQYFLDVQSAGYAGANNTTYAQKVLNRFTTLFPTNIPLGSPLIDSVGIDFTTNDTDLFLQDESDNKKKWWLIAAAIVGVALFFGWTKFRKK